MSEEIGQESSESTDTSSPSQSTYVESPYQQASWEVIGDLEEDPQFLPLEIESIDGGDLIVDPMFSDYGGIPQSFGSTRKHLPEDELVRERERISGENEENSCESRKEFSDEEIEQIRQEGIEKGRQEGIEEAIEKNKLKFERMEENHQVILDDLSAQILELSNRIEKDAVELSMQIARKLVERTVEINPEYIVELVKEAVGQARTALIKKVRVSPEDLEFIELIGMSKHLDGAGSQWEFEADPTIQSGCVVETSAGEIDFQLDKAWERIKDNVVKVLR